MMYLSSQPDSIVNNLLVLVLILTPVISSAEFSKVNDTYQQHCASCHGQNRLGGIGPALLPENLKRVRRPAAVRAVSEGLPATQMPGFSELLSDDQIQALVKLIYTPLATPPSWTPSDIKNSHIIHNGVESLGSKPAHDADLMGMFIVVESGDHHATILDGDRLEPIHRFKTRHALHGGPKYSPDGRFVYLGSRDGWVSKFDMITFKLVAEIRAGINMRNIAASGDGRYVIAGNYLPHTLVLLNASDLSLIKIIPVKDGAGNSSRVSAVYTAPPRNSFIAALKDLPEVWEISYDDDPPYYGWVHDYRDEGPPEQEPFPVRRIRLKDYLDDFFFDRKYEYLIGAARGSSNGQVVDLVLGAKHSEIELPGLPHLGSGITWNYGGKLVLATPNLKDGVVSVIDMSNWETIRRIETLGPGFFMRSHENTPYAWVDVFFGPNKDVMHVINKNTLEVVKTLRPVPGKTSGHIEFTPDGKYALLSIWEQDGALIVFDSATLKEVKRIPMRKPSGKYNVYNKISGSAGTSH